MSRLIFFSGGVESTALLTTATKDDIVITVTDKTPNGMRLTYDPIAVKQISNHFGIKVQNCNVEIPYDAGEIKFVHQMWLFLSVANLWAAKNNEITELCFGANKEEFQDLMPELYRIYEGWDILHPKVKFNHPLVHLSKQEQWNLIPDKVKPMVRTCIMISNCGRCRKCLELKNLEGSILHR